MCNVLTLWYPCIWPWSYTSGCPGYLREPHWLSKGLPGMSEVAWQVGVVYMWHCTWKKGMYIWRKLCKEEAINYFEFDILNFELKTRKVVGEERIPKSWSHDVKRCKAMHLTLYRIFCSYFHTGMTSWVWLNALIKSILKVAMKYPYVPLSREDVRLISFVSKILQFYRICNRVVDYSNILDLFQQNGTVSGK